MKTWRGAWFLAKEELRKTRWKHLITLSFIGYLTIFLVPMFTGALDGEDMDMVYWSIDFITVSLLPCLGLMSTQTMGYYWKTDSHSKKLAGWRTMPITVKQIVWGRLLLLMSNAIPALLLFFIVFYLFGHASSTSLEPGAFAAFAFFWIGYALAGSVVYTYFETGFSGKTYFWFCMCVTIGLLAGMVASTLLLETSFVLSSYKIIENGGWWLGAVGPAMAVSALLIFPPLMERKIRTRSYYSS